jgi:branched-chain amino acid transport system ATP-binding protein
MERIYKILGEAGVTSIIIEHDMDIMFKYSSRIIVMYQGRVVADGKPDEIKNRDDIKGLLLGEIYD